MTTVVTMPQLGESIVEGTVARWLKQPGDVIEKLEPLVEIATDKIDTEIPAPASGTLLEIITPEGTTVAVGSVLARIGTVDSGAVDSGAVGQWTVDSETVDSSTVPPSHRPTVPPAHRPADTIETQKKPSGREFISPVVARIAQEHAVDLDAVSGTGLGGRVTKKDILAHVAARPENSRSATTIPSTTTPSHRPTDQPSDRPTVPPADRPTAQPSDRPTAQLAPDETLTPLSTMRRAIAQHMALSKATSPHVTTVFEVDMTPVVRHREANRQPFAAKGITLTYTPYFVAAVTAGLRAVPEVNSRFTDEGIVLRRRIHVGVAVSLPDGLLVPVIRDADEKNLQGLARAVNDLANRARDSVLTAEELQGGTFTITNHGVTGSLMGTPIINQPQSGILGIGSITKRAVVRTAGNSLLPSADDALVIRPTCYLSFSFDHRVLDGAKADAFLTVVKTHLEEWKDEVV